MREILSAASFVKRTVLSEVLFILTAIEFPVNDFVPNKAPAVTDLFDNISAPVLPKSVVISFTLIVIALAGLPYFFVLYAVSVFFAA